MNTTHILKIHQTHPMWIPIVIFLASGLLVFLLLPPFNRWIANPTRSSGLNFLARAFATCLLLVTLIGLFSYHREVEFIKAVVLSSNGQIQHPFASVTLIDYLIPLFPVLYTFIVTLLKTRNSARSIVDSQKA